MILSIPQVLQAIATAFQLEQAIAPELIAGARAAIDVIEGQARPTAEQQALLDAGQLAAHAAMQAAQPKDL